MKTYKIEVEEVLQKVCEVEANSEIEALEIVKRKYDDEEIVLDYNDLVERNIRKLN